jgi:hypothetical protein
MAVRLGEERRIYAFTAKRHLIRADRSCGGPCRASPTVAIAFRMICIKSSVEDELY